MKLNKHELARAFEVSLTTVSNWMARGIPMKSPGGPGRPCVFEWKAIENWGMNYKLWPGYEEPEYIIGRAYWRAKEIVAARKKFARQRSKARTKT